jgi:hypothetical protein
MVAVHDRDRFTAPGHGETVTITDARESLTGHVDGVAGGGTYRHPEPATQATDVTHVAADVTNEGPEAAAAGGRRMGAAG